jgi:hypothetical protein
LIDASDLDLESDGQDELVEGVWKAGQPAVMGGPEKCVKTSLALAGAVAVATGIPLWGRFPVRTPRHVLFVSAESGLSTVRSTLSRIVNAERKNLLARGVDPEHLNITFSFEPLHLGHKDLRAVLGDLIAARESGLLVIDPFYLQAGAGGGESSMFAMGERLRPIAEACRPLGCTPLIVHHANRRLHTGSPMELAQLAFEGPSQWARQWILLNRVRRYRDDGRHDLVARIGQAGVGSGLWGVMVDEQLVGGRVSGWDVAVEPYQNVPHVKRAPAPRQAPVAKLMAALDAVTAAGQPVALWEEVRKHAKMSGGSMTNAVETAADQGLLHIGKSGGRRTLQRTPATDTDN